MKHSFQHVLLVSLLLALNTVVWANSAPMVTNVTASQRVDGSKIVDIRYDLHDEDGDLCTVSLQVSSDGGSTWTVSVPSRTGDVGREITPGLSKWIRWDAGVDIPGSYGETYRVRLTADDNANSNANSLVLIPSGQFYMGDHFNEGDADERPLHRAYIDSFMIGRFKVTNQQYCEFLNYAKSQNQIEVLGYVVYAIVTDVPYCHVDTSTISYEDGVFTSTHRVHHPVVWVSWYGAVAYANWKSTQEGYQTIYDLTTWESDFSKQGYRLPTEAEWEYAARGDLADKRYPWGNTIAANQANYWASDDPYEGVGGYPYTTPTGFYNGMLQQKSQFDWPGSATSYQTTNGANSFGLYDMAGNVGEWCHDLYSSTFYSSSPYPHVNPIGPTGVSGDRVLRNGAWNAGVNNCRVAERKSNAPSNRGMNNGFRVVLTWP